ncbi:MAG: type I-U CRISPR-associated protein Cas7 [Phycisphaerales bacterium]|jgi:CRISPR-associated protein Csb1|nr:type I-U CRISPR-associated protein Cas7 [Phycisphaerales bacterium]
MPELLEQFDYLLREDGPAALALKKPLMPVEGLGAVIFPPTYAAPKGDPDQRPRYNLDGINNNRAAACAIDTIGAQSNRAEPLFKTERYKHLVPQITVTHNGGPTNLLDAAHRIADAIVRFTGLTVDIHEAFVAYAAGNPEPMAKLAPTSLVFGAWDSRGTQVKIPRLITLRIDATDAETRSRSAQYTPATDYVGNGMIDDVDENTGSDLGFAAVPASGQLGGVKVHGTIVRSGLLNLATVQAMRDGTQPTSLQRYILGLALIVLTAHDNSALTLRQGCQLVGVPDQPMSIRSVHASGSDEPLRVTAQDVLTYATAAADAFGVGPSKTVPFDSVLANRIRQLWVTEKTRKILKSTAKLRPLTMRELDSIVAVGTDPLKPINDAVKRVKGSKKEPGKLPPKPKKGQPPVVVPEVFNEVREAIDQLLSGEAVESNIKVCCNEVIDLINNDVDSHGTLKVIEETLKKYKPSKKKNSSHDDAEADSELESDGENE